MEQMLKMMDEKVEKAKQSWFVTKSLLDYATKREDKKAMTTWKKFEKRDFQKYNDLAQFVFEVKVDLGLIKKEE
jgi:hypothetical protein